MTRYAILVGATSPENGLQKSLVDFKDFLTSAAGGSWREDEIMICGPMDWPLVQLLQSRLREYDFVLVYRCRFSGARTAQGDYCEKSQGAAELDWSGKLRSMTENGRGVFIGDVCDEIVDARELGYEVTEKAEARA